MGTKNGGRSIVTLASKYSGAKSEPEGFKLPEDLEVLADDALQTLHTEAVAEFDSLYGDGKNLSKETLEKLGPLTEAIQTLATKLGERQQLAVERDEQAAQLAATVRGTQTLASEEDEDGGDEDTDDGGSIEVPDDVQGLIGQLEAAGVEVEIAPEQAVTLASKASQKFKVNLRGRQSREVAAAAQQAAAQKYSMKDVATLRGEGLGLPKDSGVDFGDLGRALERKLSTAPLTQYANAQSMGRQMREVGQFAAFRKPIAKELMIQNADPAHVQAVIDLARDEKRLNGKSLVASGGWHAPSEILYNLFLELESRDGVLGLPEIGVTRGGVQITTGPSFQDIWKALGIPYFHYSEQDDIDGNYAIDSSGNGSDQAGSKPVYHVEAPNFEDYRLAVDGVIIESGLLGARGYPENLARIIRGALVAHDHKINAGVIKGMVNGSTGVTLAATQAGAAAPVLTAIELQVEHYKSSNRMARAATLEAVFPFWVRGAIRSDLSRRLGTDNFLSVPDSAIDGWFSDRGVVPQFVYDWQDPATTATSSFTQWPDTVAFLLYAAGTWVKGTSDVLTLDTLYDSVLLGQNNFTALFTEEGWFVAKAGVDSRLVTTTITPTGVTNIGADILANGTA